MLPVKSHRATSLFVESVYISPSCLPCLPAPPHSAARCKPYFIRKQKQQRQQKNVHISSLRPPLSVLLLAPSLVPPQASLPLPFCLVSVLGFFSPPRVPISMQISYKISCLKISPHHSAMAFFFLARLFKNSYHFWFFLLGIHSQAAWRRPLSKSSGTSPANPIANFHSSLWAHQYAVSFLLASRALSCFLHFLRLSVFANFPLPWSLSVEESWI